MLNFIFSLLSIIGIGSSSLVSFPPNIDTNQKTIQALINNGSNPQNPHPLEHHFLCTNEDSLKALLKKGKSLGYQVANVGDNIHEGIHYWYGDLIKETFLDLKLINKENSSMLELANDFKVEYDGWGTPIVK